MTRERLFLVWRVATILLLVDVVIEAVFAGAILSGVDWARRAHSVNAVILIASTAVAGLAAILTLGRISQGLKLGSALLSLAAVIGLQLAAGKLSAEGANLMWVHVPLGSALVGFAALTAVHARRLGGE
jgi:hypothetical protein